MKKILYLTFYFEPDISAGSFRNTTLVKELANGGNFVIDVYTTLPNRYSSFREIAPLQEICEYYTVTRVKIPTHKNGMKDQINSFKTYFAAVKKVTKTKDYDLVVASSSRLFTAYLGYTIAKQKSIPLYLDIRDIFVDTMKDVLKSKVVKYPLIRMLRQVEKRVFNYATHINLISEGFKSYFKRFKCESYSYYPNGIDEEFLNLPDSITNTSTVKTIVYAGNIGEGQGLHRIIPQSAKMLGENYKFIVIGDGGIKQKLIDELRMHNVKNVEIRKPVPRKELVKTYMDADYLLMHLNDYEAFKKVLPSKIFELGAFDKPIIAGVGGYANSFVREHISNVILFQPCDVRDMVLQLFNYRYRNERRNTFIDEFSRSKINKRLACSICDKLIK